MKLKGLILIWLMVVGSVIAHAADILRIQDVEVSPGQSVALGIELDNETANLMGWQCDIILPEGLSLALKSNGKPAATLGSRFSETGHTISSNRLSNGAYRFIATSMDGESIPGSEGMLFTVTLQADDSVAHGTTLTGSVANIEFNTQDNRKLTFDSQSFSVAIPQEKPKESLIVDDLTISPGQSVALGIGLDNETANLMGWQCDIILPEGLTLALKSNGKPAATLGNRFSETGHTISSNRLSNGAYRFIATSMDGEAIPDTEGALFTVTLIADASLDSETPLTGSVKNIEFNTQDNQKLILPDVTFQITVETQGNTVSQTITLNEGWNWISHNLNENVDVPGGKAIRIVSQTEERINDPEYGWLGNLNALKPATGYKVLMAEDGELSLDGTLFDAANTAVSLSQGWNWIGYPMRNSAYINDAFLKFNPQSGDIVVSQDGFSIYQDGEWTGELSVITPGKGYLYKSGSTKEALYNPNATPVASGVNVRNTAADAAPWTFNKYQYPNVMPVIATVYADDIATGAEEYLIGTFCGNECRGIGKAVNGLVMISVLGNDNEPITFKAYRKDGSQLYEIMESISFNADVIGSVNQPYHLDIIVTGLSKVMEGNMENGTIYDISGRKVGMPQKGIIIIDGAKVLVK